jgi:hypothetical protein
MRISGGRKRALGTRATMTQDRNPRWSLDFVMDSCLTADGSVSWISTTTSPGNALAW